MTAVVGLMALAAGLAVGRALSPAASPSDAMDAGMAWGDEPRFADGEHVLLWHDDFESSPAARDSTRFGRYVTLDARWLQSEPGGGVNGSKALRITWAATGARQRPCTDDSRLIEAAFPASAALTVSYWVRYSPGFVFDWQGQTRCQGNAKKLLLLWAREGSRFVFISENGALGVGSDHDHPLFPQNVGHVVSPRMLGDGAWHRITLYIRQGSTATAADGAVYGWIDGIQRWRYDGVVTHNAGGYYLFKMPATFNAGAPVAQTEWMDDLRIWRDR